MANVAKCTASPIRCTDADLAQVQAAFPCRVAPLPVQVYLGVPLSIYKLRLAQEQPIIDAIAAKISCWKSGLLTGAGRTLLAKVTCLPSPYMYRLQLASPHGRLGKLTKEGELFFGLEEKQCWAASASWLGGRFVRRLTTVAWG